MFRSMIGIPNTIRNLSLRRRVQLGLTAAGLGLILVGLLLPKSEDPAPLTTEVAIPLSEPTPAPEVPEAPAVTDETPSHEDESEWITHTVRQGDNLAALFSRAGLTPRDVHELVNADEQTAKLTRIFPGDEIDVQIDDTGRLYAVRYAINETDTLFVYRNGSSELESRVETKPLDVEVVETEGVISSSLYNAGIEAGLEDRTIMELAGIFGWDVDFALDLRAGDRFVVIYETLYRDGERVRSGNILAAEFINRGERYRALRFTRAEGQTEYYTPDGRSMRKAFLRTPTDFTRVSSDFNPNRLHPVLGTRRPHMGTDYAAPPGTPIWAAGDGKIIHRGPKGGYGNTVILQHGSRHTTLYAHMRSFAKGQSIGDRVRQGDTIGYVGSTGLATGPHLHYEFRVDGVHRNPRTVDLPEAQPIAEQYRTEFERATQPLLSRLEEISGTRLARAED